MLNSLSDALINVGAKIIPSSVVNNIANVQAQITSFLIKKGSDNGGFQYFDKAAKKVDTLGAVAKEFVRFCQTYIYIPTLFVAPIIILIFMFGNVQEKAAAKKRVIYIVSGIFILMALISFISMLIDAFIADGVTNKLK